MIKIYNKDMELVAFAEQAYSVSYDMPLNSLWTASFTLPANDEKVAECQPLNFVELWDDAEYIGLFRILPQTAKRSANGAEITYQCEHVLATLLDDVLFQYHTIGGAEVFTGDTLQYILSQQSTVRWQLGTCQFEYEFEYNFENDNLLGALFAVPKPFLDEYQWTWNTQVYPWQLNLVRPSEDVEAYIRYGVNMQGVERYEDPTNLCTRLYPLGYGEGVNQLTIKEVNGGLPYIQADTVSTYGVIAKTWVDRSIENPDTLKARALAILEELKVPRITYRVDASELYKITNDELDKFRLGTLIRIIDEDLGIDFTSRVVKYSKGDLFGNPAAVSLEIANKTQDVASALADLENRQRINETHAQGSTTLNVYNLAENCDPTHPARFEIWIPNEVVRINKVLLTYKNEPFRANSKAIESAPATTSGASSVETTEQTVVENSTEIGSTIYQTNYQVAAMSSAGSHSHGIPDGTELLTPNGTVTFYSAGSHTHLLGYHYHNFSSDPHVHGMDHTHEIPSHAHDIAFGIYEGPTATENEIRVDGESIPGTSVDRTNIDLVNYLSTDSEGKIKRGYWHTIEIVPNALSRVVASVVVQCFVQSRGGGDY